MIHAVRSLVGMGEPAGNCVSGSINTTGVHVEMRDGPESGLVFDANGNALRGERFRELLRL